MEAHPRGGARGGMGTHGDVPNVVFSCGQVMTDDTLYVYCSAAGTVTSMATADKEQVLAFLKG